VGLFFMTDIELLPSCLVCPWFLSGYGPKPPKWLEPDECGRCNLHHFVVWKPGLHFCSGLGTPSEGAQAVIMSESEVVADAMYVWIEFRYRTLTSPELLHVHRVGCLPIAPLEKFATLTTVEKSARYRKLYYPRWYTFKQEYGEAIEDEDEFEFGSIIRKKRQQSKQHAAKKANKSEIHESGV